MLYLKQVVKKVFLGNFKSEEAFYGFFFEGL